MSAPGFAYPAGLPPDGWVPAGETWTYAGADDPTFTLTIAGVDLTGKYQAGQRVKLTQTSAKYFIITLVAFSTDTTLTLYGGTDYDLANAAISVPYYSPVKAPFGFPLDPAKWTVRSVDTTLRTQSSPVNGTWYNLGSITFSIPIGVWSVSYQVSGQLYKTTSEVKLYGKITLSTANNTESDSQLTATVAGTPEFITDEQFLKFSLGRYKFLTLAAKTSYYLNMQSEASSITNIYFINDSSPCILQAVCAYL